MLKQSIMYFIKTHMLSISIISFILIILLFVFAFNFKTIINSLLIIKNLFRYCLKILSLPISFMLSMLTFQIRKSYLALKLALKFQFQNNYLLPKILLNLILLTIVIISINIAFGATNVDMKSTIYMFSGTLVSIWITHTVTIVLDIYQKIKNLNFTFMTIADMRQLSVSLYDFLVPYFPYKDDLFKKDDNIIYITPICTSLDKNYLKENLAINFVGYLEQLKANDLYLSFNKIAVNSLIECIRKQQNTLQMTQNTIFIAKDFIPQSLNSLFQQVMSCINHILSLDLRYPNWSNDIQLSRQMSELLRVYIVKLTNCIIFLQREFNLYDEYISFISHPPKLFSCNRLEDVIRINNAMGNVQSTCKK